MRALHRPASCPWCQRYSSMFSTQWTQISLLTRLDLSTAFDTFHHSVLLGPWKTPFEAMVLPCPRSNHAIPLDFLTWLCWTASRPKQLVSTALSLRDPLLCLFTVSSVPLVVLPRIIYTPFTLHLSSSSLTLFTHHLHCTSRHPPSHYLYTIYTALLVILPGHMIYTSAIPSYTAKPIHTPAIVPNDCCGLLH